MLEASSPAPAPRIRPSGDAARCDRTLLEAVARDDEAALRALHDRHGGAVFSLARSILRSPEEAEEVLVDVFVRLWQQAGDWDSSRGSPAAWLMVMTRSRSLDRIRRKRRYRAAVSRSAERDEGGLALPVASAGPHPEVTLRRRRLRALLDLLPEAQRDVIRMAYFGGMTQTEIASVLDIPLGTVKSRVRLAMETLARAVDGDRAGGAAAEAG